MTVQGDTSAALAFLTAWAPEGPWMLTSIVPESRKTTTVTFQAGEALAMGAWIDERQGKQNIYFTVNPTLRPMSIKPKKTDMLGIAALHVDLDPRVGEDLDAERVRAAKLLREFKPAPTVIIDSGGGFQGFWVLDKVHHTDGDEERAAELEAYNIQLEVLLKADACHNIDRIMRVPGTLNVPDEKKRKKGRKVALASVVDVDWSRVYPLSAFTPAPRVQSAGTGSGPQVKISGNLASQDLDLLPSGVTDRVKMLIVNGDDPDDPTKYGSRSETLWGVLCELVRAGCDDDQIASIILDKDYAISGHVLDQPRPQQYAARQIQRAKEFAVDPLLTEINDQHAVIEDIGGKCRVVSEVKDLTVNRTRLSRQSFEDFRNRYMHRSVVVGQDKEGRDLKMPLGKWWLQNPLRRQYRTIMFAPGREVTDSYNLWQGFACEARPGDCSKLLKHLHDNVCRGNEEHSTYLLDWMARCVQKPDSPGQVAIIMRGRMGAGKSFPIKAFGSLWGRHFLQVSNSKHLVGNFNAHLRDCVVLFGDEAFYAGDKQHESILKTMVTEETIMIEGKGVDAEIAPNYVHLMMASNSDWVVPAGSDERRYFVLDVGDAVLQDKAYFRDIQAELDKGGREAFLHFLMTRDLSLFEVRNVPKTAALQDQKVLSMAPEEQWWFEKLMDGKLFRVGSASWGDLFPKQKIMDDYLAWATRMKLPRPANATALGKFLGKVSPPGFPIKRQPIMEVSFAGRNGQESFRKERVHCYQMSDLKEARAWWDERFGGPYPWPEDDHSEEEANVVVDDEPELDAPRRGRDAPPF